MSSQGIVAPSGLWKRPNFKREEDFRYERFLEKGQISKEMWFFVKALV
jgi:hypothetical protein